MSRRGVGRLHGVAAEQRWCRVTILGPDARPVASWDLAGPGDPDLDAVDRLGRLVLTGRRVGHAVVVSEVSPAMGELLELAGLGVEVQGQTEGGEEPLGI